jgi:hypothetical protein
MRIEGIPKALRPFFAARRRSTSRRKFRLIIDRFCKGAYLHLALSKPSFMPAHQGDYQEMKTIILASIAAGVVVVLLAGPAPAQNANGNADTGANAAGSFTAKNVNPVRPFGSINTYNVGLDPARISAWAKALSADQRQEMVGRCSVIIQNQQNYYLETTNFCQNFAIAIAENIGGNGNPGR